MMLEFTEICASPAPAILTVAPLLICRATDVVDPLNADIALEPEALSNTKVPALTTARPELVVTPPKVSVPEPSFSKYPLPLTPSAPVPVTLKVPVNAVSVLSLPTLKTAAPKVSVPEPESDPTRWL